MGRFYVYVLKSLDGNHRYVGMSESPEQRLKEHNAGKVRSTKAYLPWEIIYTEYIGDRVLARKREKYLKSSAGRKFIEKVLDT